jgi:haloalkane dehalogenase
MISDRAIYPKKKINVLGLNMAYVDEGRGDPIVFLHGNPTSSYLWRNIIPYLTGLGRCIAPDLVGMGDSDKLPKSGSQSYTFVEHRKYLDAFFKAAGIDDNITLVVHDWGSGLGFDWANRHLEKVKAIAYMEAIFPMSWDTWPEDGKKVFQGFRSQAGEEMVLEKNVFIENVLPGSIIRKLTEKEMAEYRRPFLNPGEDRRPTLTWPRQLPIDGEPEDVFQIASDYTDWLKTSTIPKLFINAEPGAILTGPQREMCRTWHNQDEVTIKGIHFVQEDSPDEIGKAVAAFVKRINE